MKYLKLLIIIPFLIFLFSVEVFAQNNPPAVPVNGNGGVVPKKEDVATGSYHLLEPLPGVGSSIDPSTGFGDYANKLIRLLIGAAGALAVVMIVIGGIQYMSSDAVGEKSSGKETMQNALIGLGLALTSYLLLYTINPQLTIIKDNLVPEVSVEVKDLPTIELLASDTGLDDQGKPISAKISSAGSLPSGVAKDLAKQLIATGKFDADARYKKQVTDIAAGTGGCNIDTNVLSALLYITKDLGKKILVSSVNRKCTGVITASGSGSYHYANGGGHAFDIAAVNGKGLTGRDPESVEIIRALAPKLPGGSGFGQSTCGPAVNLPAGIKTFKDTCNHLHVQITYQ
jgi:hypothetical protein